MISAAKMLCWWSAALLALMIPFANAHAHPSTPQRGTASCVKPSVKTDQGQMYVWVDNSCGYIVQLVGVDVTVQYDADHVIAVSNFRPLQFMEPGMGLLIASCQDLGYLDCQEMGAVFAEASYIPVQASAKSNTLQLD